MFLNVELLFSFPRNSVTFCFKFRKCFCTLSRLLSVFKSYLKQFLSIDEKAMKIKNSWFWFIFQQHWRLNLGPQACKAGVLPLSHAPASFALVTFQTGSLSFVQAGLKLWSFYLCLPHSWDYRHQHTQLVCWDGISLDFFHGLASNNNPPNLYISDNMNYRTEPPHPARKILKQEFLVKVWQAVSVLMKAT
jgi:hypothetical protein